MDKGLRHEVVLIYANNAYGNVAFRQEMDEMANENKKIRIEYVLSNPDTSPDWNGKKGFITKGLIQELAPDYNERVFYISGPQRMVLSLEEQLASIGVPPGTGQNRLLLRLRLTAKQNNRLGGKHEHN